MKRIIKSGTRVFYTYECMHVDTSSDYQPCWWRLLCNLKDWNPQTEERNPWISSCLKMPQAFVWKWYVQMNFPCWWVDSMLLLANQMSQDLKTTSNRKKIRNIHTHTRLCINLRLKEKEKKERILRVPLTSGAFPLIPRLMSPKLPFSFKYWLKRLHFLAKLDIWSGDLQEFCAKFAMDDENIQQMGCC